jgi:hypothetical protein
VLKLFGTGGVDAEWGIVEDFLLANGLDPKQNVFYGRELLPWTPHA